MSGRVRLTTDGIVIVLILNKKTNGENKHFYQSRRN